MRSGSEASEHGARAKLACALAPLCILLLYKHEASKSNLRLHILDLLHSLPRLSGEMPVIRRHAHEVGDGLPVEEKLIGEGKGIAQGEARSELLDDVLLLVFFDVEQGEPLAQGLQMSGAGDDDEQQAAGRENARKLGGIARRKDVEQHLYALAGDGQWLFDAGDQEAEVPVMARRQFDGFF